MEGRQAEGWNLPVLTICELNLVRNLHQRALPHHVDVHGKQRGRLAGIQLLVDHAFSSPHFPTDSVSSMEGKRTRSSLAGVRLPSLSPMLGLVVWSVLWSVGRGSSPRGFQTDQCRARKRSPFSRVQWLVSVMRPLLCPWFYTKRRNESHICAQIWKCKKYLQGSIQGITFRSSIIIYSIHS